MDWPLVLNGATWNKDNNQSETRLFTIVSDNHIATYP